MLRLWHGTQGEGGEGGSEGWDGSGLGGATPAALLCDGGKIRILALARREYDAAHGGLIHTGPWRGWGGVRRGGEGGTVGWVGEMVVKYSIGCFLSNSHSQLACSIVGSPLPPPLQIPSLQIATIFTQIPSLQIQHKAEPLKERYIGTGHSLPQRLWGWVFFSSSLVCPSNKTLQIKNTSE